MKFNRPKKHCLNCNKENFKKSKWQYLCESCNPHYQKAKTHIEPKKKNLWQRFKNLFKKSKK